MDFIILVKHFKTLFYFKTHGNRHTRKIEEYLDIFEKYTIHIVFICEKKIEIL